MIAQYLERLERELDFDRALSRCVRQEVEDHLWEAVGADPAQDTLEAQRRAIANFGDARVIAAQFAVLSIAKSSKRAGFAAILVIAGIFMVMKARIAWYAAMQWAIGDDLRAVGGLVGLIDRYAFLLSVIVGIGGWLYIRSREIPVAFHPAYRRQLCRFFLSCRAAAVALAVSVSSDAVLTTLLLRGTGLSATSLVPIVSMVIEIVCVGILVVHVRGVVLRAEATAALMKT
jgi:hypothetical protein